MNDTPTHRPIVDCILDAMPEIKVPKGMDVGLKFTSPTQTTHGGFAWPDPGKWTIDFGEDWNQTPCTGGGVHAALTIAAAQSGGGRYTHAMLVCWRPTEAATNHDQPGKVKARRIKSLARIDLTDLLRTGALTGANLTGAHLSRADLTGANLTGANLSRADLYGAHLSRADLTGADLTGANLTGANLTGAHLSRADLTGADLTGANLTGANLSRADLYGAHLSRADLTGAYLTGADLTGAHLSRADLTGADLTGANLTGANLSRADLTKAYANKWTRWPDGFDPHAAGVKVTA